MKKISLSQGKEALVDDCDYDFLMQWKWCAAWRKKWYSHRRKEQGSKNTFNMHRAIADRLGFPQGIQIDHKNGNGLDNRRNNLRPATIAQNMRNRGPNQNNSCGVKGVTLSRSGRWCTRIGVNGKRIYLGTFDTLIEAAKAYNKAAQEHHGDFAWLNPIEE